MSAYFPGLLVRARIYFPAIMHCRQKRIERLDVPSVMLSVTAGELQGKKH